MKRTIKSAILIATIIAMAPGAFAGNKERKNKGNETTVSQNAALQLNYLGEDGNYVLLQVILAKADNKVALLRIMDGMGEELYAERFSEVNHARYFKVSPDELRNLEIEFNTINGVLRKKYTLNLNKFTTVKLEEVAIK